MLDANELFETTARQRANEPSPSVTLPRDSPIPPRSVDQPRFIRKNVPCTLDRTPRKKRGSAGTVEGFNRENELLKNGEGNLRNSAAEISDMFRTIRYRIEGASYGKTWERSLRKLDGYIASF